jgi:hypothetical protein
MFLAAAYHDETNLLDLNGVCRQAAADPGDLTPIDW